MTATEEFIRHIEASCGRKINRRAFDVQPSGNRLLVVLDKVPERYGLLHIPENADSRSGGGAGWVIAVGPTVGQQVPYPGGPPIQKPEDLLGCHVIFGGYIGKPLKFSFFDRQQDAVCIMMADRDIWAVDLNPEAAARETQDSE